MLAISFQKETTSAQGLESISEYMYIIATIDITFSLCFLNYETENFWFWIEIGKKL